MITVHLIANAHLDPIWLWPWQAGLDAALATCRSACDRLDAHPELIFTRGEAWVYQQIERVDPRLFQRIRALVSEGRWSIVNGWWIQPDCNLPSGFAMRKQIELGRRYFLDRFGQFPRVGYNVDTFGHAATLPGLLREFGQDRYVMMRPQEHEMSLPGRLFRWRGYVGGPEVVTFRIAGMYNTTHGVTAEHIQASLTELPPGIQHTMCFIGVGDHGGGPTEEHLDWLRTHANSIDGCRLIFSSPDRFFDAIAGHADSLPLVTGELQHHAIGCYSVHRPVKCAVRRAEHLIFQAEVAASNDPHPPNDTSARIDEAWRQVCFHHFHDTLGGTCIPSAYAQVDAQLGHAAAIADDILHVSLRRRMQALPGDERQQIVLFNASDQPFDGYATFEPWLEWKKWQPHYRLLDSDGLPVPYQVLQSEALAHANIPALLFPVSMQPDEMVTFRIDASEKAQHANLSEAALPVGPVGIERHALVLQQSTRLELSEDAANIRSAEGESFPVTYELIDDPSDTWSHGIDRYASAQPTAPTWAAAPAETDRGPLMAALVRAGRLDHSQVREDWRLFAGEAFIELRLRVLWCEENKVLKLTLPLPADIVRRTDGIMGGALERQCDGVERPLRDWMLLELADGAQVGIVMPDVFAADVTDRCVRLTLLRSCLMAHHEPYAESAARGTYSDQGVNDFRFRFFVNGRVATNELERHAMMLQRPLVGADLTHGMKNNFKGNTHESS